MARSLELTKKQKAVLNYIETYYARKGFSPTYEEIAERFGFGSYNSVTDYIKVLKKKGYLDNEAGKSRGIVPIRIARNWSIPLVGTITAGEPIEAVQNIETYLNLSTMGIDNRNEDKFALRVRGNSMINRGIRDGDIVIIRKQKEVGKRDVAAVRVGNDATLKYVERTKTRIKLVPDNNRMKPLSYKISPELDIEVLGKVIGLYRDGV
ncbi:MAG: repressor LexA [Gemmatimonadetes bacterium]|nr:MAG: repressor LexA [Gemmatimonadota bacterium]